MGNQTPLYFKNRIVQSKLEIMNYRSIKQLNEAILGNLNLIPRQTDLIVGIPRSGMLPANLIALYMNKPYTDLDSFMNGHIYKAGARGQFIKVEKIKNVLIVDDSLASGAAMKKVKLQLEALKSSYQLKYCVVYGVPGKEKSVDFCLETVPTPRYFQWNLFNHTSLEKACFDIDGVLCVDPTDEQNDDGPKYRKFLIDAEPLYVPGSKLGTIVTSRLEKYRKETEEWLEKYDVQYENLVMLDLPNAEARQRANNHGRHKATEYQKTNYVLFVESDKRQAIEINRLTKKPVFCTENFEMIYESQSLRYNLKSGKHLPFLREIALKVRDLIRNNRKDTSDILNKTVCSVGKMKEPV
jgi:uncharacterized HAD superfamily protein/hypoxanthine phosphoribosyltransferase